MEQTKSKNWKDTLAEVRKVISFHEFELILDKEKRSRYDEFYFFKRGLKMTYRQEGYEESWIELLLKMIDVRVYCPDDFKIAEQSSSYQEFENKLEFGENFTKYSKVYEFDKDDVTGLGKISDRFSFGYIHEFSYNQAIMTIGIKLSESRWNDFRIFTFDKNNHLDILYEGDNVFDWFNNQDADYFRDFRVVVFYDRTNDKAYTMEKRDCDDSLFLRTIYTIRTTIDFSNPRLEE